MCYVQKALQSRCKGVAEPFRVIKALDEKKLVYEMPLIPL